MLVFFFDAKEILGSSMRRLKIKVWAVVSVLIRLKTAA
jgi:hypothetical protein